MTLREEGFCVKNGPGSLNVEPTHAHSASAPTLARGMADTPVKPLPAAPARNSGGTNSPLLAQREAQREAAIAAARSRIAAGRGKVVRPVAATDNGAAEAAVTVSWLFFPALGLFSPLTAVFAWLRAA